MPTLLKLGKDAVLFRNTGVYVTPTWTAMPNIKDLRYPLRKDRAEADHRGYGGWGAFVGALKNLELIFDMIYNPSAADVEAVTDSWWNSTILDFLVLDGPLVSGNKGVRFDGEVFDYDKDEALRVGQRISLVALPAYSDHPPVRHTVA